MAKKSKAKEDRLSDLPDSILVHILSMICENTKDSKKVVRSSVLSKRWQFLWMSVPVSLHVRFPNREKHVVDYLNSICRDLHYWRCCHKIRKFSVFYDTCDPKRVAKDVDLCFYFASKLANVEHFQFISDGGYVFPQFAYKNTSWRKLDIESCMELKPLADVKWSGIVSLSIGCTYLTDGSMEKILSGCPNLECLQLDHFWGFHRLEISNVKSRELIIDNLETDECDVWLDIIAPYIQNLKILGSCRGIYLRNVASLVTVVFNFEFDFEFEEEEPLQRKESTCLKELFQSVAHVEKLELGPWCIQYLSIMELEGWQPPPSSWKFLQLHVHLKQLDFPGICCFLQSSSDLETLVIDGYEESRHCKMTAANGENSTESSSLATLAPLQAVLFDVDGTLCDSDPLHYYAFREMLLEIGYNHGVPVDEEWFIKTIAGNHNDDIASALFPDDQERGLKFCDEKEAMFRRLVKEQLKPIDGLYKVKKWIEDRGLKRAAVTNAPRLNAELIIEILGLKDFFDVVIIGSECERAKPSPDPYLKALELLKVSKEHTFIFEDSASGIKAGVAAGMPVVGLATRNPPHILMEAKPAFLIKDYEDSKLWAALEEIDKKSGATTTTV